MYTITMPSEANASPRPNDAARPNSEVAMDDPTAATGSAGGVAARKRGGVVGAMKS